MPTAHLLKHEDYKSLIWKNGRGTTEEIAIHPPESVFSEGRFDWRVSSAPVIESGSFSQFPEHDRILVILTGNGVRLNGQPLAPLVAHSFSGADETYCELINGPITDLSVFVRRGLYQAQVEVLALSKAFDFTPKSNFEFLYVVNGQVSVADGFRTFDARERDTISMREDSQTHSGNMIHLESLKEPATLVRITLNRS